MKKLIALLILTFAAGAVFADNMFAPNNPFLKTSPQSMNNIYESEPAQIEHEKKKASKSWFRKGKNLQEVQSSDYVIPQSKVINEGVNDGSFYVFK